MSEMQAKAEFTVRAVHVELTDRAANDLYNDLYRLQVHALNGAMERQYPALFDLFDALFNGAGIDGTR